MAEYLIKINEDFKPYLLKSQKKFEYRKLNKNYIEENDIIHFVSLDYKEYYCKVRVVKKQLMFKSDIFKKDLKANSHLNGLIHNFMIEYYKNEVALLRFELSYED